jgi:hypothetical protein
MRKLAREAVIFVLLTGLAVVVISYAGITVTPFLRDDATLPWYMPLVLGVFGFPAGLAIWSFYRLIRFAVKG